MCQPNKKERRRTLKIFNNIDEETKKSIRDRIAANALIDLIVGIILIILQRLF